MSILEKLVEDEQVTSKQLYDCVVATVDDDTMKKIIGEGLFMYGKSEIITNRMKKATGRALKFFYINKRVWQTDSIVCNVLLFLDSQDCTWQLVCTKWKRMYNDVHESQTIKITDDQFPFPPQLTSILDLYTPANNIPVVAQIRTRAKYHPALGISIVITGRFGDLKRAILTQELILKLHKKGDLSRLQKDAIVEITKSTFNTRNYTTYIDELQIW